MKTHTRLTFWMTGVFLLAINPKVFAQASSPQKVIQNGSDRIQEILKVKAAKGSPAEEEQKQKLKKVVDGFLDYRELSMRALANHWKDRTAAEQNEFVDLLRELIESTYTGAIQNNVNYTMRFDGEELEAQTNSASVTAVASAKNKKGKTVSEDLLFHLYVKDKRWMIFDIEFGDVSLVRHYKGEFNRKIKKESYAALLQVMRKKLDEVKAGKFEKKMKID